MAGALCFSNVLEILLQPGGRNPFAGGPPPDPASRLCNDNPLDTRVVGEFPYAPLTRRFTPTALTRSVCSTPLMRTHTLNFKQRCHPRALRGDPDKKSSMCSVVPVPSESREAGIHPIGTFGIMYSRGLRAGIQSL